MCVPTQFLRIDRPFREEEKRKRWGGWERRCVEKKHTTSRTRREERKGRGGIMDGEQIAGERAFFMRQYSTYYSILYSTVYVVQSTTSNRVF